MKEPVYHRVLLKVSGEALSDKEHILNFDFISRIAAVVKKCTEAGVQVAVLCGAGNIWRGRQGTGMDHCRADHMGMLATAINALAIADTFEQAGLRTSVMTAVPMQAFADPYSSRDAIAALEEGRVVILGCGLGTPCFSTDTAAAIRAAEIHADVILMAKNIDGIYTADPMKDKNAVKLSDLTYHEMMEKNLRALDMTATILCMDNNINSYAFALKDPENIYRVVMGEPVGTALHN